MTRWMIVLVACALTACALTAPAGAQEEPLTLEEGLARIQDLGDEQRWDEALPVAEALVAAYPDSADAVLWRGIAHRATDNAQAARADFERAVALDPANLRAQYHRAFAAVTPYDRLALDAAMRAFADVCADGIAADPTNADAYLFRGLALRSLQKFAAAEADLLRAVELEPDNPEALEALAGLMRADRRDDAIALLERVVELRPLRVITRERLADRYDRQGRLREAIEQCELSAEINPRRARPYSLMASIYWTSNVQAALAAAERALELEPGDVSSVITKARLLIEGLGDADAALAVVDEGLATTPDDSYLLMTRSVALQALGRDDEALEVLNVAVDVAPVGFSYAMRFERAKLLYKLGRHAEAWQDVHVMDREMEPYGTSPHAGFREQLEQAMPEPQPEDNDAPAAPPEEGN